MNAEQKAEALRLAKELEWHSKVNPSPRDFIDEAAALLRTLAAEPQVEPVAWLNTWHPKGSTWRFYEGSDAPAIVGEWSPLYRRPAPAQTPLTDEQIRDQFEYVNKHGKNAHHWWNEFARAIEKAHGIGV